MPRGKPATPQQTAEYRRLRREGHTRAESCRRVGMSTTWGYEQDKDLPANHTEARERLRQAADAGGAGPIGYDNLSSEAQEAWHDFEYFGRRYFGRIYRPWQIETAHALVEELASGDRSYVVENCPPGVGKTTLAHDIGCWVTVRDRRIRACMGSRKENNAARMVKRIRRSLESTVPIHPPTKDIEDGVALEAESCMAWDYGLFRPEVIDTWRQDEFIVAQHEDRAIVEKEPTWSAYGQDSGVLSNRFDLIIWDDVVDNKTLKTLDAVHEQRRWWDEEAVTRLEPGGVVWLIGQRMASNDLYRYCLDKRIDPIDMDVLPQTDDDGDPQQLDSEDDRPAMYRHIKYKAHYQENCQGADSHRMTSPAWPEGCLLDPYRLSWRDLAGTKSTNETAFLVQYQQEDADPASVLIPKVWIWGGRDPDDGSLRPGCVDTDRDICSPLPAGMIGQKTSIATVDPSGTNRWACLAGDSLVETKGGEKPIRDIEPGEQVLTRQGWKRVLTAGKTGRKRALKLELSNGRTLQLTPDHRVLTHEGWRSAGDLDPSSLLVAPDEVVGLRHVDRVRDVPQMFGVHAQGVGAGMVDLMFDGPVGQTVGQAVRQPLPGLAADVPVWATAVGGTVGRPVPNPAAVSVGGGPGSDVVEVVGDMPSSVEHPIAAPDASRRVPADGGVTFAASVHIRSIAEVGQPIDVYDLEVEDAHEFVAEGVVVHNCQWWVTVHTESHPVAFLMDLEGRKMQANDLLDWNGNARTFYGLMEEWQQRSTDLGLKISHWVVEDNAAQRYLLVYDHVRRWQAARQVNIVPHTTGPQHYKRIDNERGPSILRDWFKHGRIRLPGRQGATSRARIKTLKLESELTKWPHGTSDDQVMAAWFHFLHLPRIHRPATDNPRMWRPTWMSNDGDDGWAA